MQEDNARLKRLLDKQRRALQMPKSELGELEEEYAELLSRIDSERKRLNIDDDTITTFLQNTKKDFQDDDVEWYLSTNVTADKKIADLEQIILKAARAGDVQDCKYYKNELLAAWRKIQAKAHQNQQLSL